MCIATFVQIFELFKSCNEDRQTDKQTRSMVTPEAQPFPSSAGCSLIISCGRGLRNMPLQRWYSDNYLDLYLRERGSNFGDLAD